MHQEVGKHEHVLTSHCLLRSGGSRVAAIHTAPLSDLEKDAFFHNTSMLENGLDILALTERNTVAAGKWLQ